MIIEAASIRDILAISELNKIFRKAPDIPIKFDDPDWIKERIENFHVIRDDYGIAAQCCVTINEGFAKLDVLVIREDRRLQGLSKQLIGYAILIARKARLPELRVGSAKRFNNREYYLRQGFQLDHERTNDRSDEFILNL